MRLEIHGITSITIPDTVSIIGQASFVGCYLDFIKLPESITRIEAQAFEYCPYLEEIYIPKSVTYIGNLAFYSAPLKKVYYGGTSEDWSNVTQDGQTRVPKDVYYYSKTKPETEGNYWHYVAGQITEW